MPDIPYEWKACDPDQFGMSHEEARRVRAAESARIEKRADRRRAFWHGVAINTLKAIALVEFIAIVFLLARVFGVCL